MICLYIIIQANQLMDFCSTFSNTFWQVKEHTADINTTSKWIKDIYTAGRWNSMTSLAERKNKGKAPAQGYSQEKRGSAGLPFVMHEGVSSRVNPKGSKSLQEFVPAEVTYSNGDMVIALQEVLSRSLQFHNGTYTELPNSIKFIFDNLHAAFTLKRHTFFQKTLQALEIHLVNTTTKPT